MKQICIVFMVLILFSCRESSEDRTLVNFALVSTSHTGCFGEKSVFVKDNDEKFIVSSIGDENYKIEHLNVTFNCCLYEGIAINVFVQNDTIFYTDEEKVKGYCKCVCTYNTEAEIGGISNGSYVLCFRSGEVDLGLAELNFNTEMYEEIKVSDLRDYK